MRILKQLLSLVFLFCCFSVLPNASAAAATLNWKGYTWDVYEGGSWDNDYTSFSSANVTGPDANGYITLKITNPSGDYPIGSSIDQSSLGYGTYTVVVGSSLSNLDKNIAFGGISPLYYPDHGAWFEIDGSGASRWDDGSSDVLLSHDLWYGSGDYDDHWLGDDSVSIASDAVQTHRLIWEPGKITMDAYLGTGTAGTNYFHTVITSSSVPVPGNERVDLSLWAYYDDDYSIGYNDTDVPATNVIVRDFTFKSYYSHDLTVNSGTGSGSYTSGASVTITANAPASGQVFDRWTGDISYLASTTSPTTTVTMPGQAMAVTATYKAAPVSTYALTVIDGTGGGSYASGASVTITANAPPSGQVFDRWTGSTSYLASSTSPTTTVTMPAQAIAVAATYKAAPATTYALVVNAGTGDGYYIAGSGISITADAPASGKVFDQWTGNTSYLSSVYTATATVVMPAQAIALTATYKNAAATTYALTVTSGTGDGSYAAGTSAIISANAPASGQVFDKWTGDITYISSVFTANATVTMPAQAITLTATYKAEAATTYALTVAIGTGDGSYTAGTGVTITADAPATGKTFDKWTGDISYIANANNAQTVVTMPAKAITLTATYKSISTTYNLSVNYGSGSGYYAAGVAVTVTADAPASGKVFNQWTGDTFCLSSIYTAVTTATMPAAVSTLTATYKDVSVAKYIVTVSSGSGSGTYTVGQVITIGADVASTGKTFDKWTGDTQYVVDVNSATTTVTVPDKDINLVATYVSSEAITYKDGTLIRIKGATVVYIIVGGKKKLIPSLDEFERLGYNWADVVLVTQKTLDSIPDYVGDDTKPVTTTYPAGTLLQATGSTMIYVIVDGQKRWIPTLEAFEQMGYKWGDIVTISQTLLNAIPNYTGTGNVTSGTYSNGTLVQTPDSFKVYLIIDGKKKWIPTPEVFEQLGYKWTNIVQLSRDTINFIPDYEDNLIRSIGNYKVYLVVNGVKRHIPNPEVFLNYGFKWEEVRDVPQATVDQYRSTYLIKVSKVDGIYYLSPQEIKKIIPTTEVFNSYNDKTSDIQVISQFEMNYYPTSNVIKLSGTNEVYLIEGNVKRKIPTAAIFDKYKLNWNYVLIVNQAEFNFYQTGADLR